MDLGTMEIKIKEHGYSSISQFREDLQLIVDNSILFNGPNSQYTVKAQEILAIAEQLIGDKAEQVCFLVK